MGGAFPRHTFSARIAGENRGKFSFPLETLEGKTVCVIGKIQRDASRARNAHAVDQQPETDAEAAADLRRPPAGDAAAGHRRLSRPAFAEQRHHRVGRFAHGKHPHGRRDARHAGRVPQRRLPAADPRQR
ncbi:hypothetical protein G6F59_015962 [Rhizopus arrhizus]|nr:hypothetical protein G6F59_015962 [Rhizopus arrhizus]